jgi:hypothetical protein
MVPAPLLVVKPLPFLKWILRLAAEVMGKSGRGGRHWHVDALAMSALPMDASPDAEDAEPATLSGIRKETGRQMSARWRPALRCM